MDQYLSESVGVNSLGDLNHLYHKLLDKVRSIETKAEQKAQLEQELSEARDTLSVRFLMPIVMALKFTLYAGIPFIVVFFILAACIKNADGVRYFTVYDHWYGSAPSLHWLSDLLLKFGDTCGVVGKILAIVIGVIVFFLIPAIVVLLPLSLIGAIIITVHACNQARTTVKHVPGQVENLGNEIDDIIDEIAPGMSFVPPDYRYSDALEFICRAFDNHKADSLKEALLQYDDYAHKCRLELGQQEMIGRLNTAIDMIQEQNDKLDSIHSEVRSVNSKVNWLMWL